MKENTVMKILNIINKDKCSPTDIKTISEILERKYIRELIKTQIELYASNNAIVNHKQEEDSILRQIQNIDVK